MQLKNIIFDIEENSYPASSYHINPPAPEASDTVVVCDSKEKILAWKKKGFACIGVESRERIAGVDYITDRAENVDDSYAELVFCRHHGQALRICETKRLCIREMTEADVMDLYGIYKGNVLDFTEPLYPYEEELEFTRSYIQNMYGFYGYGLWLMVRKEDGKIIGRAGFSNRTVNGSQEMELGYLVGEEFQKQGYALEACEAILGYGFEQLEPERIIAFIDEKNVPSIRLAQKLGFHELPLEFEEQSMKLYALSFMEWKGHNG